MTRAVLLIVGFLLLGGQGLVGAAPSGLVGSSSAHAPGSPEEAAEHEHGPRHGGAFGDAEDLFHYELVLEPSWRLVFYVNDDLNRPLDARLLQGRWILNPDDPSPMTGMFTSSEDGAYLFATLPNAQDAEHIHVQVEVLKDDQWVGMEFFIPSTREPQPHGS